MWFPLNGATAGYDINVRNLLKLGSIFITVAAILSEPVS